MLKLESKQCTEKCGGNSCTETFDQLLCCEFEVTFEIGIENVEITDVGCVEEQC